MILATYQLTAFRQMAGNDIQGGKIRYGDSESIFDCTVGTFDMSNPLMDGGKSPRMLGVVEVAMADYADATFEQGHKFTVTPTVGAVRNCKLESFKQDGALWQLTLEDLDQGA